MTVRASVLLGTDTLSGLTNTSCRC